MGDVGGHGVPASRDGLGALKGDENALAEETRQGVRSSRASGALPEEVVERTDKAAVGLHGSRSECVARA